MGSSTGVAPVCNAIPPKPTFITPVRLIPSFTVPNVNDPQSIIMALVELQTALIAITQPPPLNNIPNGPNQFSSSTQSSTVHSDNSSSKHHDFSESHRVTRNVKVVNPTDSEQYVIVKEIMQLAFKNPATGQKLTWNRNNPKIGAS